METLNQSNLNNEYIFNEEWKKLVKNLFKGKESIKKSEIIKELTKKIPTSSNINTSDVKAFNTEFTWKDIISAIEHLGNKINVKALHKELEKIYLNK